MCEDLPEFKKGMVYLVKAHDHFTRLNGTENELFVEFLGVFIEEMEFYYKFVSYYYREITYEEGFHANEFRFVLKCAVYEFKDLGLQAISGKFEEKNLSDLKIEE